MQLTHAQVTNFKCIKDSTKFSLDQITSLVGKNEAGKTAILQALERLNPLDPAESFIDEDFPRQQWTEFKRVREKKNFDAVTSWWTLTPAEMTKIQELVGNEAFTDNHVVLSKGYYKGSRWKFELNEKNAIKFIASSKTLHQEELAPLLSFATYKELENYLSTKTPLSERETELQAYLTKTFPTKNLKTEITTILSQLLPKMVYFDRYHLLPGQVAVNDFTTRFTPIAPVPKPDWYRGFETFNAFINMLGATVKDLNDINQSEKLTMEMEGASSGITKQIFRYWTQNRHLKVRCVFENCLAGDPAPFNSGRALRIRIENIRHGASVMFDDRSAGFVWFFSFIVWFSQAKETYGDNLLVLLDEPGLSLHAKAQADLLRYFEEQLRPKYQLIYSTHSPFMIDSSNLASARTVEDIYIEAKPGEPAIEEPDLGTKVGEEVLSTDRDTIFPLQGALGYEITQTLFIGKNTLLVEGPSDILYLKIFSDELKLRGKTGLSSKWTICPTGGVDKVPAFVSLFGGNQLHVAILADFKQGQKGRVSGLDQLHRNKLLQQNHILTANIYAQKIEADIEDIIGTDNYVALVNECYKLTGKDILTSSNSSGRVLVEVENHFRTLGANLPEFDHYSPSAFLLENRRSTLSKFTKLDDALTRFETLFTDLNKLL